MMGQMKTRLLSLGLSLVLSLSMVLFVFQPVAKAATTTAVVTPATQYQTWEGWGTSLAWFANVLGGTPDATRNWYADKLFSSSGLNFNIARYNIGGGENPAYPNNMQYRARVPGFEPTQGTYNWNADANQRWFLQAAKSRGANLFEAFSNSPPYWMTNSGSVTGAVGAGNNIQTGMFGQFADYLTTVVKHFHDSWGIDFRTLEPFNEPGTSYWAFGGGQEGTHVDRGSQATIIQQTGQALIDKAISTTHISASDETNIDSGRDTNNSFNAATKAFIAQYNVHTYNGSDRTGYFNSVPAGARIWMSEHGDKEPNGITMSRSIINDIRFMKNNGWVYWQAVEDSTSGPGWGMVETDLNNPASTYPGTVKQKFYAMQNWSKFILPGYKIIDINDGNSIAAYDAASQKLVIVTLNDTTTANTVTYDLTQFGSISGAVTAYRTAAAASEKLAPLSGITLANKQFSNSAPANSITTYIISGVSITGSGAFDPTATYKLVNRNSSKVLDVAGGSITAGALVDQYNDNGGNNQKWKIISTGNGYYKLINLNSNLALDVVDASLTAGALVQQYTDNGGTNQRWNIVANGSYFKLGNQKSGMVLDVKNGSGSSGAGIIQWTDTGGLNQQWSIIKN